MMKEFLFEGARAMGIPLTREMAEKLAAYHEMLVSANRAMNLTRVPDDPREAADRNYLDALSPLCVAGLVEGAKSLVDVGTGAGLPGVPLAIALPQVRVTLIDSLGKRVKFLEEVIRALDLNACAVHARCEEAAHQNDLRESFDLATARAVAELNALCELSLPFVRVGGRFLAYKGPAIEEELPRAQRAIELLGGRVQALYPATIPGRDWDHRLLSVVKRAPTPLRYPRRPGEPARKPL